jgi:hypothetical protein
VRVPIPVFEAFLEFALIQAKRLIYVIVKPAKSAVISWKLELAMPRYFFHMRTADGMHWDGAGFELASLSVSPDAEITAGLWQEVLSAPLTASDQILVVTNDVGQVVFVSAI